MSERIAGEYWAKLVSSHFCMITAGANLLSEKDVEHRSSSQKSTTAESFGEQVMLDIYGELSEDMPRQSLDAIRGYGLMGFTAGLAHVVFRAEPTAAGRG